VQEIDMQTLVALYRNFDDAENAVDELVNSGIDRNMISLVANNTTGEYSDYVSDVDYDDDDDAVTADQGAAFGAASGGIIGALAGLGALAIPGIGPVIAAGPLIAALTGGAVGALAGAPTGGLVAGLIKTHHIDDTDAEVYAEGVRRGENLLTVQVEEPLVSRTRDILNRYNPTDIHNESSLWRSEGWSKFDESATPYSDVETYRSRKSTTSSNAVGVYPVKQ
jgi:tetrahydromethanopterin S-methyltransferase subunit F